MFCTFCAASRGRGSRKSRSAALIAVATLLTSGLEARAQQNDSVLKQAFKVFGFATDTGKPADFVDKTRAGSDPGYIPVFQPPPEPTRPTMKAADLKAMQSDLNGVEKQHDAIRQAFPPAAKALAEQQAAKKKPSSSAPSPRQ